MRTNCQLYLFLGGLTMLLPLGAGACGNVIPIQDAAVSDDLDAAVDLDTAAEPDARAGCKEGFTGEDCAECTVYVDGQEGSDENVGLSWNDALSSVGRGIAHAVFRRDTEGLESCAVWVREGSYRPGSERSDSFVLRSGIRLYGGFSGTETELAERDWESFETVLSGELTGTEHAHHVLIGADGATLDGFIVTGGLADGEEDEGRGAGMVNDNASPTIQNVIFAENISEARGGAMYNGGSSAPTLRDVTFTENRAKGGTEEELTQGGAMYNDDDSAPSLTRVSFVGNNAEMGGAMYNADRSEPTLEDVDFEENWVTKTEEFSSGRAGAMYNAGESEPVLTRVSFVGNKAEMGGAMYNANSTKPVLVDVSFEENWAEGTEEFSSGGGGAMYNASGSAPTLNDVRFSNNQADKRGGAIFNRGSEPVLVDVSFVGNSAGEDGGAIGSNGSSKPILTNVIFANNEAAERGGALYTLQSTEMTLANVVFVGNEAGERGGAMYTLQSAQVLLTNASISGNQADDGGAMYHAQSAQVEIVNSIIWDNSATDGENEIAHNVVSTGSGSITIRHSIVQDMVESDFGTNGEVDVDFENDADPDFADEELRIGEASEAIDAGNTSVTEDPDFPEVDLDGNARVVGEEIDMGAYEFQD